MKLYYAQKSPFTRKALVVSLEAGVEDKFDKIDCSTTTPINPDAAIANPIKKLPALELDDGTALFDSPVLWPTLISAMQTRTGGPRVPILLPGSRRSPIGHL